MKFQSPLNFFGAAVFVTTSMLFFGTTEANNYQCNLYQVDHLFNQGVTFKPQHSYGKSHCLETMAGFAQFDQHLKQCVIESPNRLFQKVMLHMLEEFGHLMPKHCNHDEVKRFGKVQSCLGKVNHDPSTILTYNRLVNAIEYIKLNVPVPWQRRAVCVLPVYAKTQLRKVAAIHCGHDDPELLLMLQRRINQFYITLCGEMAPEYELIARLGDHHGKNLQRILHHSPVTRTRWNTILPTMLQIFSNIGAGHL